MDISKLKERLPKITQDLCDLMIKDGLGPVEAGIFTLDEASPTVSIGFIDKDSGRHFDVGLSIELKSAVEAAERERDLDC